MTIPIRFAVVAVLLAAVAAFSFNEGRKYSIAKTVAAVTQNWKERGKIDADVSTRDIRKICRDLGGREDQCSELQP